MSPSKTNHSQTPPPIFHGQPPTETNNSKTSPNSAKKHAAAMPCQTHQLARAEQKPSPDASTAKPALVPSPLRPNCLPSTHRPLNVSVCNGSNDSCSTVQTKRVCPEQNFSGNFS
ncbi:hypothetical protein BaRGS_00029105 [Batillaria attramentaria]|uniref:Uncharacterized protein n=1 Tax=Batillaria attramentaria TaxID=370345 RepID=A0ABD0JY32_9CAEN